MCTVCEAHLCFRPRTLIMSRWVIKEYVRSISCARNEAPLINDAIVLHAVSWVLRSAFLKLFVLFFVNADM